MKSLLWEVNFKRGNRDSWDWWEGYCISKEENGRCSVKEENSNISKVSIHSVQWLPLRPSSPLPNVLEILTNDAQEYQLSNSILLLWWRLPVLSALAAITKYHKLGSLSTTSSSATSYEGTNAIHESPTFVTNHLPKPTSKYHHIGIGVSAYDFWGHTNVKPIAFSSCRVFGVLSG